ncbi:hypothetical protein CDV55_105786 [Aspergillus turcosus]|uniref:Uncharacterized protein n=1 Tax=Aspergillus turcosus TaxID=1245748 RepID=A0A229XML0_9EURO|nr:hypothetical protein CDV55_105786 [Aspergillus turcosus]RLM01697.1 hypothetical protein CFD26_108990 [Aspergillus turcosus]
MALTRALADPTLGATSGGWFIYDDTKSTVIEKTSKSATALAAEGFELDHVFERQFLSGLIVHVVGDQDPPLSIINDLLLIANLPENLVWIRKDLHGLKSNVFGRPMAEFDARLCTYLTQCQLMFGPALDRFSTSREDVKLLIRAMKETPWYLGHWDGFKGESWFG